MRHVQRPTTDLWELPGAHTGRHSSEVGNEEVKPQHHRYVVSTGVGTNKRGGSFYEDACHTQKKVLETHTHTHTHSNWGKRLMVKRGERGRMGEREGEREKRAD